MARNNRKRKNIDRRTKVQEEEVDKHTENVENGTEVTKEQEENAVDDENRPGVTMEQEENADDDENRPGVTMEQEENADDDENGPGVTMEQEENDDDDENRNDVPNEEEENAKDDDNDSYQELNDDEEENVAHEKEVEPVQPPPKRRRGPTRMKHIAKDPNVREPVEFTELGEPCGPGSVKLSSYLGPLVREHVPIIVEDWRKVGESIKTVLWKSIQSRFELDEEYQKTAVFRQMGCLWRSSKSRIVTKIRKAKNMKERMELKPKNIPPVEWRKFVNLKTSSAFKAVSDSYKERRQQQIPHTVSRKGMVRLTEEMKKSSPEPSQVTRLKVWVKSRTKKDGSPVNNQAAEKIRKAKDVQPGAPSSSTTTVGKNDTLTQILGPDNPGRLRAMGRGISTTKLACYQVKSAHLNQMEATQAQLQDKVRDLEALVMRMNTQRQDEQGETSAPRSVNKSIPSKCLLVDWTGTEETVAEARLLSADPEEFVSDVPLGPNSVKVLVETAIIPDAFLWRPTTNMTSMEEAVGQIIAWKADNCVPASEAVGEDEAVPKSPYVTSKNRCKLMDWASDHKLVAEGRCASRDPQAMVNGIPLGPNAVKVYVDVVLSPRAFPWRPAPEMTNMEQTVNSFIAWPANRVEIETHKQTSTQKSLQAINSHGESKSTAGPAQSHQEPPETPKTSSASPMAPPQTSPQSPKAPPKKTKPAQQSPVRKSLRNIVKDQKCKLMDISGKKRVVAEGRWSTNDPNQTVHFVPLGPKAVRVWVEVVKVKTAAVWRPSSEIETMDDALGGFIAWPEDKVVMF